MTKNNKSASQFCLTVRHWTISNPDYTKYIHIAPTFRLAVNQCGFFNCQIIPKYAYSITKVYQYLFTVINPKALILF